MKRGCSYTILVGFFLFIPLLFNVQIKDFQMSNKKKEIADAIKKENLIGKRKDVVFKSLETVFKGEAIDKLDDDKKNETVFVFNNVASSFDTTLGPGSWDIWLTLRFDRKNNRLIRCDLADSPGARF